jgi:vanillate/3-O-methylgallate O-demethylase
MTDTTLSHSPYLPFDPGVVTYNAAFGHLLPWEFSGWKRETMSWKEGCYLHAGLNPPMPYRLTGPGALRLLEEACVNGFAKFSVGASKHAVMCNEQGNVMADGMVWRLGEEEFVCFFLSPFVDHLVASGRHDVEGTDMTGSHFLFQVAGPRSLDVLEAATGESLRDIEFLWHRPSRIRSAEAAGGKLDVQIYRLGVARTLAYEVHGRIEDAHAVYRAIMAAGEAHGIERLGLQAYGMNHTEGGFAQSFIHFLPAFPQDEAFMRYLDGQYADVFETLPGSAGSDVSKRFANPVELGWGHMIKFDHEFTGRSALEQVVADPRRTVVTLEWNEADILEVYASQFRKDADHQFMDFPANPIWHGSAISTVCADDVLVGDDIVGISSGRMFSEFYKAMISLALVDVSRSAFGSEVEVLWGDPGTKQKRIRATVARFPYLDLPFNRNTELDVKGERPL